MSIINDTTTNLALPLPNISNALSDDVGRLRSAFSAIDDAIHNMPTSSGMTAAINAVIGSAPGALDTLAELASALGNDANFASTVTNALAAKAPLASPTFTGTVAGITAAMVGAQPAGTYATGTGSASGANTGDQTLSSLGAQAALVSGTNIKTVGGVSLLGSGNVAINATGSNIFLANNFGAL